MRLVNADSLSTCDSMAAVFTAINGHKIALIDLKGFAWRPPVNYIAPTYCMYS